MTAATDRIEILPVSLLDTHRELVEEMRRVAEELNPPIGWHYLLDLSWAAHILQPFPGMNVLDAGAGTGIMQWWLAAQGVNVLSVDRTSRADLEYRFRAWCPVRGLRPDDLHRRPRLSLRAFLPPRRLRYWHRWPRKLRSALLSLIAKEPTPPNCRGTVTIYNQSLADMSDISDASVDAVVSISALEHNDPDKLRAILEELIRVLKPGGKLIATLAAARDSDWFHEPSRGWCYTEASLRDIFDLPGECPSDYDRYDELFEALRNCRELHEGLPDAYFGSGNNGMPWGVWDPKYQPVGIVKGKKGS